jgi:hypothetical protein
MKFYTNRSFLAHLALFPPNPGIFSDFSSRSKNFSDNCQISMVTNHSQGIHLQVTANMTHNIFSAAQLLQYRKIPFNLKNFNLKVYFPIDLVPIAHLLDLKLI